MLVDFSTPIPPEELCDAEREGVPYRAARWSVGRFIDLMEHLAGRGRAALEELGGEAVRVAWESTVAAFLDPTSAERRALAAALPPLCRLSSQGLAAGLEAVLGGVSGAAAAALFRQAERRRGTAGGAVVVLLASNLPALAVQPLLPALALASPVLLKSPSAEPLFAPAFTAALARRQPLLAEAVAAVTWSGGDEALEAPLLAAARRVLAYGEAETLADLGRRAPGKLFGYGPRTSLAVVGAEVPPETVADGLARDVALFDQRGCLSVAAVYTDGDAGALAGRLAAALGRLAEVWPPGPVELPLAAAVRQTREEAALRGLQRPPVAADSLAVGTVVIEPRPEFRPSPGLRTVRVHPLEDLGRLPALLAPWRDRLQGVAAAGRQALALVPALEGLGVSRSAPPGRLQAADAAWHNGGAHPLAVLADG